MGVIGRLGSKVVSVEDTGRVLHARKLMSGPEMRRFGIPRAEDLRGTEQAVARLEKARPFLEACGIMDWALDELGLKEPKIIS